MKSAPPLREVAFPEGVADEARLFVSFLGFLRESIVTRLEGLTEEQARWRPDGRLISLIGIVNHLTHVEQRWIDGAYRGEETSRSEEEFTPPDSLSVDNAIAAYRAQGAQTDAALRMATSLAVPCRSERAQSAALDLRWVAVHLVEETARHAGHADATREMLDGAVGV